MPIDTKNKYLYSNSKDPAHVLRPLLFRHRIKALLRLSTNTNFCYLKFDLTNCSWEKIAKIAKHVLQGQLRCQNDCNTILYDTSFSSKVERVLFQPLHRKSNCRGLRCGHFATSTDLLALILQFWQFFSQEQFVKSNFK